MFDGQGVIVEAMATKAMLISIPASNKQPMPEDVELAKLSDHTSKSGQSGVGSAWIGARLEKLTVQIRVGFVAKLYTFDHES